MPRPRKTNEQKNTYRGALDNLSFFLLFLFNEEHLTLAYAIVVFNVTASSDLRSEKFLSSVLFLFLLLGILTCVWTLL